MCKVYNQVGSLTAIKAQLHNHGIKDFHSINDLISFLKNFSATREQIISNNSVLIKQEKEKLKEEIVLLEDFIETCRDEYTNNLLSELDQLKQELDTIRSIQSNFFERINGYLKGNSIQSKIRNIETNFNSKIANSLQQYSDPFLAKKRRLEYIDHNFERAVQENIIHPYRD